MMPTVPLAKTAQNSSKRVGDEDRVDGHVPCLSEVSTEGVCERHVLVWDDEVVNRALDVGTHDSTDWENGDETTMTIVHG